LLLLRLLLLFLSLLVRPLSGNEHALCFLGQLLRFDDRAGDLSFYGRLERCFFLLLLALLTRLLLLLLEQRGR
jgi:hypothetical protein